MPYLMGGYPSIEDSVAAGLAAADAGADLLELGIPFSDPLADGPVIHAAGTEALAAGATPHGVLGVCEQLAARVPVVLMVYANIVLTAGVRRLCIEGGRGRRLRADRSRPAPRRGRRAARGLRRRGPRAGAAGRADDHAGADRRDRRRRARVRLHGVAHGDHRRARRAAAGAGRHGRARARRDRGARGGRLRHLDAGAGPRRGRDRRRRDRGQPRGARGGRGRGRRRSGSWSASSRPRCGTSGPNGSTEGPAARWGIVAYRDASTTWPRACFGQIVEQSCPAWLVSMSSSLPFSSAPPAPLRLSGLRSSRWRWARRGSRSARAAARGDRARAAGASSSAARDRRLVLLVGPLRGRLPGHLLRGRRRHGGGGRHGRGARLGARVHGPDGRAFTGERLSGRWAAATALGCAGVCMLVLGGGSGGEVSLPGVGLALARGRRLRAATRWPESDLIDQGATPEA